MMKALLHCCINLGLWIEYYSMDVHSDITRAFENSVGKSQGRRNDRKICYFSCTTQYIE